MTRSEIKRIVKEYAEINDEKVIDFNRVKAGMYWVLTKSTVKGVAGVYWHYTIIENGKRVYKELVNMQHDWYTVEILQDQLRED